MHAFPNEANAMIAALQTAYDEIDGLNQPEIVLLKGKILGDLKRHINSLKVQLGIVVEDREFQKIPAVPIRKIMGRVIGGAPSTETVTAPFIRKTAQEVEIEELRLRVSEIYPQFLITPADDLLDTCSDMEIRGVAKKAGLPVTETNPAKIDVTFINQIKGAIQQQITIANQGDTGAPSTETDDETSDSGNTDAGPSSPTLAELEEQLQQLKEQKAHYTKIKAVEGKIAELKAANQDAANDQ